MDSPTIFVAVKSEPLPVVREALSGYKLIETRDLQHARDLLGNDIDLFVLGILFDDSRAMELITLVRTSAKQKDVPILVVRLMPCQHEEMLRHVMNTMKAVHTVSEYLEAELSDSEIQQKIRATVEKCLPSEKRL